MTHQPRKRFGQNFLHDPALIARICAWIDPRPEQALVEIGPGRGALTGTLLKAAGALTAIELDRDLIAPLHDQLGQVGALRLLQADALTVDYCALAAEAGQPLRLVGNLPYNISTPLLFHFLAAAACVVDLHLLLQKEVVERMVAAPNRKIYGRLSVMVQTQCAADWLLTLKPGAFTPAPKVESALVRLVPYRPARFPCHHPALHARVVAAAFAQRRKTLRNSLRDLLSEAAIRAAGIDPGARAENLSVADFIQLTEQAALELC